MARRYARDGLGRFASGGGGGRSSGGASGGGGTRKRVNAPPPPAWSKEMLAAKAKSDKASKSTTTAKPVLRGRGRVIQPSRATYRGTDKEGMAVFGSAKKPKTYKIPSNTPKAAAKPAATSWRLTNPMTPAQKAEAKGLVRRQNEQLKNQSKKPLKWR